MQTPPKPERIVNLPPVELSDYCRILEVMVRQLEEDGIFAYKEIPDLREKAWVSGSDSTRALERSLIVLDEGTTDRLTQAELIEHAYTLEGVVCHFISEGKFQLFEGQGLRRFAQMSGEEQARERKRVVSLLIGRFEEMTAPSAPRRMLPPPRDFT